MVHNLIYFIQSTGLLIKEFRRNEYKELFIFRFGEVMKHAGVAVTVTTFTDVIAFLVGSNTLLPVLQSFCVYAAISIFTIYALQVTHFVAWFSLGKMVVI